MKEWNGMLLGLRRTLRRPAVITLELAAVVLAGVIVTFVPQQGDRAAISFRWEHPWLASLVRVFELDRVLTSAWFLLVLALATASLAIVIAEQVRRAAREWKARPAEASFRAAPFQRSFERAAGPGGPRSLSRFETSGRLGLLGSPLFHVGILTVMVAGLARALFAGEAKAPFVEGEVISSDAKAWTAHHEGFLARPFALRVPVEVQRVELERHPSGELRALAATVSVPGRGERRLAINEPLDLPGGRLYLTRDQGLAALLELQLGAKVDRATVMMEEGPDGWLEGEAVLAGPTTVKVRCPARPDGGIPGSLELRVLRGGGLLFAGRLGSGSGVEWPGSERLAIAGVRHWVEIRGTRDPSTWLLFAGVALAVAGVALMFAVIRIDTAVVVVPSAGGERVVVALKAQRLAPVFRERFERLVEREGGRSV